MGASKFLATLTITGVPNTQKMSVNGQGGGGDWGRGAEGKEGGGVREGRFH
jgi:hypothetical protein